MNEGQQAVEALKTIALETVKEQKRARRWGIFFKLFFVAYLLGTLFLFFGSFGGKANDALADAEEITATINNEFNKR